MLRKNHIWRADITGLRALAVIPVVLYHAFPNILSGGFIGVDIFFVISGYLISGILFRQLQYKSSIDFAEFYGKRVRRIFPNLILLLIFVAVAGYFVLFPPEYEALAKQIYSSAVFIQNFRLLTLSGNYFSPLAETQPLLHLWSLAIEEQFYLLFPLLCWLLWKLFNKNENVLGYALLLLTSLSLAGCLLLDDKNFVFYFPLTRFWELGFGILLAYAENFKGFSCETWQNKTRDVISLLGIALIGGAVFLYTKETVFPGWASLPPVIGAVLLILSGSNALINKILSMRALVFVGLISYSLYLWHWPILVYGKLSYPSISNVGIIFLIFAAIAVSAVVYKYVETPARLLAADCRKAWTFAFSVGMLCVFCAGQGIKYLNGLPNRFEGAAYIAECDRDFSYPKKLVEIEYDGLKLYSTLKGIPQILVIGDSHAEQYSDRIQRISEEKGIPVVFVTHGGCPLTLNLANEGRGDYLGDCRDLFKTALHKLMKDPNIRKVVLANQWGNYAVQGKKYLCEQLEDRCLPLEQGGFKAGLTELVNYIQKYNKKIYALQDVPWDVSSYDPRRRVPRFDAKDYKKYLVNVSFPEDKDWMTGNDLVKDVLKNVKNSVVINPVPYVCPNNLCNLEGYKDNNHLRSSWIKDHAVWIDQIFED